MNLRALSIGHRCATFEISNGFPALTPWCHAIELNGRLMLSTQLNVFTVHDLQPDTAYEIAVTSGDYQRQIAFRTRPAAHVLDVREFGAMPDGKTDNTAALQAAISATPSHTVLEFPAGNWLTGPLFLRSHVALYFARGARLQGHPDILHWPVLPPTISDARGGSPLTLGSWEGVPDTIHAGLLTGIDVRDVRISGRGCIDANASFGTWWSRPKEKFIGRRPRTLYLVGARNVSISGMTLLNAPSWTLHALRCRDVQFLDLTIEAPEKSPNTDGINPESCQHVTIAGARISTGDDCIAIKSGKSSATSVSLQPSRAITISNCILRRGHAAVALGSEMSGGIHDVTIRDCTFEGTQRGLRIKTRRGRGRTAVVRGIRVSNVHMREVGTPFVVNCFYNCDPDGKTAHVANRAALPIDDGTPSVMDISISNLVAHQTRHCAAYVLGLPEQPIESVSIDGYHVTMDPDATPGFPDRADSINAIARAGLRFFNIRSLTLKDYSVSGFTGPELVRENVAELQTLAARTASPLSELSEPAPHVR